MDTAELRESLAEFRAFNTNPSPIVEAYYQFYGMDMVEGGYATHQTIGLFRSGGEKLVGQAFFAKDATTNALVVHGFMDHTGLFGNLIRHLLNHKINVFMVDLAGHGLSTGKQCSISSFFDYTDSLNKLINISKKQAPTLPWYLFGQSMGGALSMTLHLLGGHVFEKTVLLAPLVRPAQWVWVRQFHSVFSPVFFSMPRSFHGNSHDIEFNTFLSRHDTLQTKQIPVQWVNAWREWKRWYLNQPIQEVSVLLLQGTDDHSVDWHYALNRIPLLFPNVQIYKINGARHHMVNESWDYLEQIFAEIDAYLLADELSI